MTEIKAVFFDFDDTLGDRRKYAYDCYRKILQENCQIDDPVEFEAAVQDCMLWDEHGNINKNHVKDMLKKTYGIELPFNDFNTVWDERLWEFCVPYPDAADTLEQLQKEYRLALITNGPSDGQRKKLKKSGLDRFFAEDSVFVSGDFGFHKPDPRLFQYACSQVGVAPEEAVYVGDIYGRDVLGAYRAGLRPVWICTYGNPPRSTETCVIYGISELPKCLKSFKND